MEPQNIEKTQTTNQQLRIGFMEHLHYNARLDAVSAVLDGLEKSSLAHVSWSTFPYKPDVQFSVVYGADSILLKFYVEEQTLAAAHSDTHSAVFKDSCVEFFISFDEKGYYNFEFNCIGACLAAFGRNRAERELLPLEVVDRIRRRALIDREPKNDGVRWTLTLIIPLAAFTSHHLTTLQGRECRANFYKCGEAAGEPHFLSWTRVGTPEPDFHQPPYFGTLIFD